MGDKLTADETGMERPISVVIQELHRRARNGFRHAPFTLAFLFGLVFAGGFGVWLEVWNLMLTSASDPAFGNLAPLRTALSTYFPAVIGAAAMQMTFEDDQKANRGIAIGLTILLLVAFLMMTDRRLSDCAAFALGIASTLVSLWTWCAANGNALTFQEQPLTAPVGGDVEPNAPIAGSDALDGLKY
ncbi:hypothetical protein CMV14_22250 [Rhizorhabdus dicambivorans]|nr:hypothetical protein CMV14_22250 [Rhizorhabdus dicambivorans]